MNSAPNKLTPVVISAVIMIVIANAPLVNVFDVCCCGGMLLGGFIGTIYFSKQLTVNKLQLIQKDSLMIGILSGIIAGVINTGIYLMITLFSKTNQVAEIIEIFNQMGKTVPPETLELLDKYSQEFVKYGYSPSITIFVFLRNIILSPLFGMFGSFIAYQIYKKRNLQNPNLPIQ